MDSGRALRYVPPPLPPETSTTTSWPPRTRCSQSSQGNTPLIAPQGRQRYYSTAGRITTRLPLFALRRPCLPAQLLFYYTAAPFPSAADRRRCRCCLPRAPPHSAHGRACSTSTVRVRNSPRHLHTPLRTFNGNHLSRMLTFFYLRQNRVQFTNYFDGKILF
jgi:hypothetical protein